ncbi:hypothetical protein ALC62_15387 [Cyphomyrmex costatus]|uniref:Uncharacterized protein n=1 Tax=Cyphomyrmex costatus TaxID=456900 RepID=A0A151K2L1_9HYME|nr:hypothetical protein ALC62_15387 [Cyphomyrmex costatus]
MANERGKIAREIERTSESIRRKHRALKTGRIDEDRALDRRFGPIVEPLRQIADSSPIVRAIKTESPDATPKRKREEGGGGGGLLRDSAHAFLRSNADNLHTACTYPTVGVDRLRDDVRDVRAARPFEPRHVANSYGSAESKVRRACPARTQRQRDGSRVRRLLGQV